MFKKYQEMKKSLQILIFYKINQENNFKKLMKNNNVKNNNENKELKSYKTN